MKKNQNILNILYICLILNLIPIGLLGLFKISSSLYYILNAIAYSIQSLLLLFSLKSRQITISSKRAKFYIIIIINSFLTFIYDISNYSFVDKREIIFMVSLFINILFFILAMEKVNVSENEFLTFCKRVCFIGIVSVIINVVINYKEMLNLASITNSYSVHFSSFFPNRNQYGLFMLIMVIMASHILAIEKHQAKKYISYIVIFTVNLILSMSRTSMLGLAVFGVSYFFIKCYKDKSNITKEKSMLVLLVFAILACATMTILRMPKLKDTMSTLFLRIETLKNGSGRFTLWKNGIFIVRDNNLLFGVGRYKGLELNKILFNNNLGHFHSLYIEKLVTHGLVGLGCLAYLLVLVWNKAKKANTQLNTKIVLEASLISFCFFSIFETTTRFSIGYADTTFLIFFFTLPILMYNMSNDKIKRKRKYSKVK